MLLLTLSPAAPCASPSPTSSADTRAGELTFAACGDLIGPHHAFRLEQHASLAPIVRILRSADVAFGNEEGSIFDPATFPATKAAENGGGYPLYEAAVAGNIRQLGIALMSKANNHATDWGLEGLLETDRVLAAAGIVQAGSGASEAEARAPAFVQTNHGQVALIAAASTFTSMSPASTGDAQSRARPGQSVIRTEAITLVTPEEFAALRAIAVREGWRGRALPGADARELWLAGSGDEDRLYRLAATPGLTYDMNAADERAVLESIRSAKARSRLVVFSLHAHETATGAWEDPAPADFIPVLFHHAIEAGADIVVRTGPHALQGIEIYHGRPILYGMGSLFFEVGGPQGRLSVAGASGTASSQLEVSFPASWYEGAIALIRFRAGALRDIRVYPLTIERQDPHEFGFPHLAAAADAQRILESLRRVSRAFGTSVQIEQSVGIVVPSPVKNELQ